MTRQLIKHVLGREDFGATVTVAGWVRTRRDSKGGFSFIEINDGSSFDGLQIVAPGELPNYETDVLSITIGSAVRITGELVESPGKGQSVEIKATEVEVYGFADPDEVASLECSQRGVDPCCATRPPTFGPSSGCSSPKTESANRGGCRCRHHSRRTSTSRRTEPAHG